MTYMIFSGALFVVSVGLIGVKFWIDERREQRWHKMIYDLINRKMARDFYDYVNGTGTLHKDSNPQMQMFEEIEQQIRERQERGNVPDFINQDKAKVPIDTRRTY